MWFSHAKSNVVNLMDREPEIWPGKQRHQPISLSVTQHANHFQTQGKHYDWLFKTRKVSTKFNTTNVSPCVPVPYPQQHLHPTLVQGNFRLIGQWIQTVVFLLEFAGCLEMEKLSDLSIDAALDHSSLFSDLHFIEADLYYYTSWKHITASNIQSVAL